MGGPGTRHCSEGHEPSSVELGALSLPIILLTDGARSRRWLVLPKARPPKMAFLSTWEVGLWVRPAPEEVS
jgi:hypothetical protein